MKIIPLIFIVVAGLGAADAPSSAVYDRLSAEAQKAWDQSGAAGELAIRLTADERDTALARVAPLEAQVAALKQQLVQLAGERDAAVAAQKAAETKLAQIKQILGIP